MHARADIAQHQSEEGEEICVKTAARLATNIAYQNKDNLQAGLIIAGWDKQDGGTVWGIPLGGTLMQAPYAVGGSGSAYIYGYCDKVRRLAQGSRAAAGLRLAQGSGRWHRLAQYSLAGSAQRGVRVQWLALAERLAQGSRAVRNWGPADWLPCPRPCPAQHWRTEMSEEEAKAFVVKAIGFAMAWDASSGGCIRTVTIDENGARRDFLPGSQVGAPALRPGGLHRLRLAVHVASCPGTVSLQGPETDAGVVLFHPICLNPSAPCALQVPATYGELRS